MISLPQALPEAADSERLIATRNPCHLCAPLGASLVFKGIEGAMPLLHGSQGCSTYIRRYLISHFREPIDIASSNFSEASAIFGGKSNLHTALANLTAQYQPSLIGVATTCLSETIGDDVPQLLRQYNAVATNEPMLVHVSTPSYKGTHVDGFHAAVCAVVDAFTVDLPPAQPPAAPVALFAGIVSPADLRYLQEILADFNLPAVIVPNYADTLDGPAWEDVHATPPGGTPVADLRQLPHARAGLAFSHTLSENKNPAHRLAMRAQVPPLTMGLPIGIRETDVFFDALAKLSGRPVPPHHTAERGRLLDAYVDAHKYLFDQRVIFVGEPDLLLGMISFLCEVGAIPVLVAPIGSSAPFTAALNNLISTHGLSLDALPTVVPEADFVTLTGLARAANADLILGSSKAYPLSRELRIPLLRIGFPIHDRFGGQRLLHLGYRGTQQLLDRIVNAILERRQDTSDIGYAYL